MKAECVAQRQPLRRRQRVRLAIAKAEAARPRRLGRERQDAQAIRHQRLERRRGAIPFEHREFRRMQRAALAIAEHAAQRENPPLARRQQLLHREFWRGVEIGRMASAVRADHGRCEGVKMGLVAGRSLQRRRLDFEEAFAGKTLAQRRGEARARRQARPPVGVSGRGPEGRGGGQGEAVVKGFAEARQRGSFWAVDQRRGRRTAATARLRRWAPRAGCVTPPARRGRPSQWRRGDAC